MGIQGPSYVTYARPPFNRHISTLKPQKFRSSNHFQKNKLQIKNSNQFPKKNTFEFLTTYFPIDPQKKLYILNRIIEFSARKNFCWPQEQ